MKKIFTVMILSACLFSLSAEGLTNDFTKGQELYRADETEAAIPVFKAFIAANPSDDRVDDALWYLGRLYRNTGDLKAAEEFFYSVLADPESNRRTEAFYDIAKILDGQDREAKILELMPAVYPDSAMDLYAVRILPTVLKSYSLVGSKYRKDGLGDRARGLWLEALSLISMYSGTELEAGTAEKIAGYRIKILVKLAEISPEDEVFQEYSVLAVSALNDYALAFPENEEDISAFQASIDVLSEPYSDLDMNVSVLADYNGMTGSPGVFAEAGIGGDIELDRRLMFHWTIDYRHNAFDFKSFNFSSTKTGDERYYAATDKFSAGLKFDIGSKYFFLQRIAAGADLVLAEDPGDFNYGGDLSWDFSKSIGSSGILSLDNSISTSVFPDYLNGGNEINNIKFSTKPRYEFIISPGQTITAGYGFDYKYYLNAHYDTIDKGIDPDNRRYFIHDGFIDLMITPLSWLTLDLGYNFEYLDSANYDLWLYGSPANMFVTDFYDYYRNSIDFTANLNVSIYSAKLKVGYGQRNFKNYPARNDLKEFTGDLRVDTEFSAVMENRFEVFSSAETGSFSAALDGSLNYVSSNHTYETSYVTNYFDWKVSAGVEWKY